MGIAKGPTGDYNNVFDPQPSAPPVQHQAAVGIPAYSTSPPVSSANEFFSPPDQDRPVFIGATIGHAPIALHCGTCGYRGPTTIRGKRGWFHYMAGMMTLGIVLLTHLCMDTAHHCPSCNKQVAVAKLM
ncbi:hypothetical protein WJX73_007685 [Symbiochloris irregularis]|uniref:LITAF domain-containing protein n=1 Tax=Symbiochloris irregularis TaxID=706552 RepID=A0AAW1NVM7_9CHLO